MLSRRLVYELRNVIVVLSWRRQADTDQDWNVHEQREDAFMDVEGLPFRILPEEECSDGTGGEPRDRPLGSGSFPVERSDDRRGKLRNNPVC